MAVLTLITLSYYLLTLAATQTTYGAGFMNARWLGLGALLVASGFYWFTSKQWKKPVPEKYNLMVLMALCLTSISIITAENPLYSGLRWLSFVLLLFSLVIFIRESFTAKQIHYTLLFVKILIAALLLVSWMKPLSPVLLKNSELYRGSFGSSNAMGQVAAIGSLLYLHGILTGKKRWLKLAEGGMACLALWLTWSSGARSAMVAFIVGICLMNYFYRGRIQTKTFLAVLCMALLAVVFPEVPARAKQFVLRIDTPGRSFSEEALKTRIPVWEAAWNGFQKRPLFGWGFGADDSMSKEWEVRLKSLGTVKRDNVNDTLIALEGTGIVGFLGYILLVVLAVKQFPTRRERWLLVRQHSPPYPGARTDAKQCNDHAISYIIAASLIIMVQLDNTALSAGNFISACLWLFVSVAGAAKRAASAQEAWYQRSRQQALQQQFRRAGAPTIPSVSMRA